MTHSDDTVTTRQCGNVPCLEWCGMEWLEVDVSLFVKMTTSEHFRGCALRVYWYENMLQLMNICV